MKKVTLSFVCLFTLLTSEVHASGLGSKKEPPVTTSIIDTVISILKGEDDKNNK